VGLTRENVLLMTVVVVVVTVSYIAAFDIFLIGDDFEWLNAAYEIPSDVFSSFQHINSMWRPLVLWSFLADFVVFGPRPAFFMGTNLAIHMLNALLLLVLMLRLHSRQLVAGAATILFAVSPLHSEAVLWASSRGDTLLLTFWLAALLVVDRMSPSSAGFRPIIILVLMVAAAGSKESWIALPFVATAYLVVVKRWPLSSVTRAVISQWLLLALYMLVFFVMPSMSGRSTPTYYADFDPLSMVYKSCHLLVSYLEIGALDLSLRASVLVAAVPAAAVLVIVLVRRNRPALWALLWAALAIGLASPFPDTALRHNYLPLAALWLAVALIVDDVATWIQSSPRARCFRAFALLAAGAALCGAALEIQALQLEIADYRLYGDLHRQLVEWFREIDRTIPDDRPLLLINRGTRPAVLEAADSMTGLEKTLYVRRGALWQLVRLPPLANFVDHSFSKLLRPVPADEISSTLGSDFSVLVFSDSGFRLEAEVSTTLQEAVSALDRLPEHVSLYRYQPVNHH
jgi:hypothetical protein